MQRVEGHLVSDDNKPNDLAELFCSMDSDKQAQFLNRVAEIAATWPNPAVFQWRYMEDYITEQARSMLKDIYDHTEKANV